MKQVINYMIIVLNTFICYTVQQIENYSHKRNLDSSTSIRLLEKRV